MRALFGLILIFSIPAFSQVSVSDSREPEDKEEQEAFEEWNEEEAEARERAERERWILEERARGYEPTSRSYKRVMPPPNQ